ncbi:hypothetical protein IGI04_030637 [Brassica rapa subsp. trilocularis]|uniref:Uncharacterized protein n=1 Tax=Brassica rapa subsp. trilocularis TaxID=1813537 RepID=A0ABQ7LTR1_BRACM|nr:hypothetical protein IGI04_030637 [Brassica rapa subsp. trilocularis]
MEELGLGQVQERLRRVFGQVCKLRDWPYGFGTDVVRTVRIRTDQDISKVHQSTIGAHLRRQKKEAGAKDRLEQAGQELCIDHVSSLIYGKVQGSLTATNQAPLPLSSKLTPMPFPNQEEASWSFGCSTSSRRRCAHQWRPEAVLGRSPLSHGRPEERRPLEACPSHSHSLSKKKGESFQLVPGMATQK